MNVGDGLGDVHYNQREQGLDSMGDVSEESTGWRGDEWQELQSQGIPWRRGRKTGNMKEAGEDMRISLCSFSCPEAALDPECKSVEGSTWVSFCGATIYKY